MGAGDDLGSSGSGQGGLSGGAGSHQNGSEGGVGANLSVDPGAGGANQTGGASNPGSGGAAGSGAVGVDGGTQPDAGEPPPTCPGLTFGASCYEFVAQTVAWDIAEAACAQRNAHLASVETLEEDTFLNAWPTILAIPAGDGSGVWLGATDAQAENDFRWPDDTPLIFNRWGPNQPDNGVGVDCVEKRNDATTQWYDQRCADLKPYVCERPQ